MRETQFNKIYGTLNSTQKEAVDSIEGPVMVVAGPGTGKTSILTLRIANILRKTDTAADSILALTFTESGTFSMREKLKAIIGSAAYQVHIHTFHSFCNEVIQKYSEEFPRIIGSQGAGIYDQVKILENIFREHSFKILKPYGNIFYYVRPVLNAISDIKRENISSARFKKIVKAEQKFVKETQNEFISKGKTSSRGKGEIEKLIRMSQKNEELARVYAMYEKNMARNKLYDYDDMLLEVISALERGKNLLLMLQEEYQYILADEHQDANNSQNRLLELLVSYHDNPNLFIVGDEKQAIYRFQGASLENFLYFKKKYPDAKLVALKDNYRSSQVILDAAHGVIGHNNVPDYALDFNLRMKLEGRVKYPETEIKLREFKSFDSETSYVAESIVKDLKNGVRPDQIAVLYRDNSDALLVTKELDNRNIPYVIFSNEDAISDEDIKNFVSLLKAVDNPDDERALSRSLHSNFLDVNYADIWKVISCSSRNKMSLIDAMRRAGSMKALDIENPLKLAKLADKILGWCKSVKNDSIVKSVERMMWESGFIDYIIAHSRSAEKLQKVDMIIGEIGRLQQIHKTYTLSDFLKYIELLETHGLKIESYSRRPCYFAVKLMTAHKSKGMEFDSVYIIRATDKHWGNKRVRSIFSLPIYAKLGSELNDIEDERRLFYVALTRAKKYLNITYSVVGSDGREQLPSQFVEELDKSLVNKTDTDIFESNYSNAEKWGLKNTASKSAISSQGLNDGRYIVDLFQEEGLSVTALNNYLDCPWKYFFNNLVRLPSVPERHQLYGSAIHAALKIYFDALKSGEQASKHKLVHHFEKKLINQPLSEIDFKEMLERGRKALSGYHDEYKNTWPRNIINEFNISGVYVGLSGGKTLLLKGRLDKVEILGGDEVNVVDYKTGKPKSRSEILGKTKNSKGDIKRQLDFYRLLLDNYEKGKYLMVRGEIDFIEPGASGKYRKERFEIDGNDSLDILKEVVKVGNEIMNLDFIGKTCSERKCEWCEMGKILKLNKNH